MRTFINLVEEHETDNRGQRFVRYDDALREMARRAGDWVACLRFPIQDVSVPSVDTMRSVLDAVDLSLAANRPVYLHCFGGVGRTGTVVCCWLLRHRSAQPHNIFQVLKALRQADRQTIERNAPETSAQLKFVERWLEVDV
jgi:protein-tyrosine phosphatase